MKTNWDFVRQLHFPFYMAEFNQLLMLFFLKLIDFFFQTNLNIVFVDLAIPKTFFFRFSGMYCIVFINLDQKHSMTSEAIM